MEREREREREKEREGERDRERERQMRRERECIYIDRYINTYIRAFRVFPQGGERFKETAVDARYFPRPLIPAVSMKLNVDSDLTLTIQNSFLIIHRNHMGLSLNLKKNKK